MRQLNDRKEFARAGAEGGEAEDVVVGGDEGFDEAAGLGEGAGAKVGEHGDLGETVGDSLLFCFVFSVRPTWASSGSMKVQEGTWRPVVVRLAPARLSRTMRKSSKEMWVK